MHHDGAMSAEIDALHIGWQVAIFIDEKFEIFPADKPPQISRIDSAHFAEIHIWGLIVREK
jgi:hypothetical protein